MSLRNAILGLLVYEPMTGYDLKNVFDKSISFIWPAHLSQIYKELGSLEKSGLVSSRVEAQKERPDKRIYSISAQGIKQFGKWLNTFPTTLSSPVRHEFGLRLFFGSKLKQDDLVFHLQRYISEKKEEINTLKNIKQISFDYAKQTGQNADKKYWDMLIKRGCMLNEAEIQWAQECLAELKQNGT